MGVGWGVGVGGWGGGVGGGGGGVTEVAWRRGSPQIDCLALLSSEQIDSSLFQLFTSDMNECDSD